MSDYIDSKVQARCENCLEWVENCKCNEYGLTSQIAEEATS